MAYNQQFTEVFDEGIDVKKITTKVKSFCNTGYIINLEEISEENAKDFFEFQKRADASETKLKEAIENYGSR